MGKKSDITQSKIAESAKELFIEKGFTGVRMQELADRAGVNKGLLHHYFKNKQGLFDLVFTRAFDELFGKIELSLEQNTSFEEKLDSIIDAYSDILIANPKLPIFVLSELQQNPNLITNLFTKSNFEVIINGLKSSSKSIEEKEAIHIILTIVSLSVFPFMAKPIVLKMAKNEKNFVQLMDERRPLIKNIVKNLVKTL